MAASNIFMSWVNITATPNTGNAITLNETTSLEVISSDGLEPWQADGNKFATALVSATGTRGVTISGGNCAAIARMPKGTVFTISATLRDAINGTGSGAITLTLVNAVVSENPISGVTNKYAGGSVTLMAFSADGSADPLTFTQAA